MSRFPLFLLLSVALHASAVLLLADVQPNAAAPLRGQDLSAPVQVSLWLPPAPAPVPVRVAQPKTVTKARPESVKPAPAKVATRPVAQPVKPQPCLSCELAPAKATPPAQPATPAPAVAAKSVPALAQAAPQRLAPAPDVAPVEVFSQQPSFVQQPQPPQYPSLARRRNQQGVVVLEVRLDAGGAQREIKLLRSSGVTSLDEAALKAVAAWRFRPETRNGRGVPSRVQIPVEFALLASR